MATDTKDEVLPVPPDPRDDATKEPHEPPPEDRRPEVEGPGELYGVLAEF